MSIGGKIARGAVWMIAFRMMDRGLGVVSTVVLARLLVPSDFGLVAMATSMIAALAILGAFSFDLALIQNAQATRSHFDTVWTFNVCVGLMTGIALIALAWPTASFYREPRLPWVMLALAIAAIATGFTNVGVIAFRKDLTFDREFRFLAGSRILSFMVTLLCAFTWRNYWALVAGMVSGKLASVLLSYKVHPYRPRISLAARGDLFHFSKWLFLNNVLLFANGSASNFIIGRIAGAHALGVYGVASEVSTLPSTELSAPIQRAVYPGYAALAKDLQGLRKGILDVLSGSMLIVTPASTGIFMIAQPLVDIVLGPKWAEATPVIQVLAFSGLISALSSNAGYVYLALGKPRVLTLVSGVSALILIPASLFATMRYGILGAAWALFGVTVAGAAPVYAGMMRELHIHATQIVGALWRPALAAGAMAGILHLQSAALHTLSGVACLAALVLTGVISYSGILILLWWLAACPRGAERFLFDRARALWDGWRSHV